MKLLHDESAQAGGLWMVVSGIFIAGFFYIAFGAIMNQMQVAENNLISSDLPVSQDSYSSMDLIFKFWWGLPIFAIILYIIYGIKNALTKQPGQI